MASPFVVYGELNTADTRVQERLRAIERYKSEAKLMSSYKIYQEYEKSSELLRLKYGDNFEPRIYYDPENQKRAAFFIILRERSKNKEPYACLCYGLLQLRLCRVLSEQTEAGSLTKEPCSDALENLKVAARNNNPAAMQFIAIMYKDGLGVKKSKYVAADWFIKAAKQWHHLNSRENALSTIEDALNIVPDHPGALRLRKLLFNE